VSHYKSKSNNISIHNIISNIKRSYAEIGENRNNATFRKTSDNNSIYILISHLLLKFVSLENENDG